MAKKWRVLGYQTNYEWYDLRTKFKQLLRKITYSWLVQELICLAFMSYMRLVYFSCRKVFINPEILIDSAKNKTPLICVCWHNRLMMMHFVTNKPKKIYHDYTFMILASRHGDGKFVGRIMEKFGLISIYGSSKDGRKSSRGIDIGSFKKIFTGLKKGYSLGITPDGPRGPNQKINGEIVNIARLSGAGILVTSNACSRFKQLNTWDKFKIPLPFSKLCFYFDDAPFYVARDLKSDELENIKTAVEERMDFIQDAADKIVKKTI